MYLIFLGTLKISVCTIVYPLQNCIKYYRQKKNKIKNNEPTFSVVELKLPGNTNGMQHLAASERGHCQVPQITNDANDDNVSIDSNSPLFDDHD